MTRHLLYVKYLDRASAKLYQIKIETGPLTTVYLFAYLGNLCAYYGHEDDQLNGLSENDREYFDFFCAEFHQHFNAHDLHQIISLISEEIEENKGTQ
jgi:hypothetical protein